MLLESVDASESNNGFNVIDGALKAPIEEERRWLKAQPDTDLPGAVPPDLTALRWDN